MRAPFKALAIAATCLLALVIAFAIGLFRPDREDLGHYRLESGVEVRLFVEADWDVGDLMYYSIRRNGEEVVRTTYITNHDCKERLQVHTAASTDKSVVGLWADGTDVFILYHIPSRESWPQLRDDEVSYTPSVEEKWHARYLTLRRSHPELPVPSCFREAANKGASANRRPAGQSDGSDNLSAIVTADRAFPAAVAELGRWATPRGEH